MSEFVTIDIDAPDWTGPFLRGCYIGSGRSKKDYPTDDLTRSAITSGGGWIYACQGRFQVSEGASITWVNQGESILFTNPTHVSLIYPEPVKKLSIGLFGEESAGILEQVIQQYGSFHRIPPTAAVVKKAKSLFLTAKRKPVRSAHSWSLLCYEWLMQLCKYLELHDANILPGRLLIRNSRVLGAAHPNFISYAKSMGYNPDYLARSMKKSWGNKSPARILRLSRLQEAESLLRTTNMQIREIAKAVCYSRPESFATAFKRTYGVSPLRFRHLSRSGQICLREKSF